MLPEFRHLSQSIVCVGLSWETELIFQLTPSNEDLTRGMFQGDIGNLLKILLARKNVADVKTTRFLFGTCEARSLPSV